MEMVAIQIIDALNQAQPEMPLTILLHHCQ